MSVFATLIATFAAACSQEAPPEYPSALITVDTDLAIPETISRLRVDLFNAQGAWIDQREFTFTATNQWPVSFGVFRPDDTQPVDLLLRLRAFSSERDYLGERFVERKPFVPDHVATTLQELCASAPELPHGSVVVQRAGLKPLFASTCNVTNESPPLVINQGGSVAGFVNIPTAGKYRFEVVTALLQSLTTYAYGSTIHLVKEQDCLTPETFIECNDDQDTDHSRFGHIERALEPGRYAIVTGNPLPAGGNVAIRWAAAEQWGTSELPPPTAPNAAVPATQLRLESKASTSSSAAATPPSTTTPATEPSPDSTVDRLVRLHLEPGAPQSPHIMLTGACAGTMSKLAFASAGASPLVSAMESTTCVEDGSKPLVAVPVGTTDFDTREFTRTNGVHLASFNTSSSSSSCAAEESDDSIVCVPSGSFVLGGTIDPTLTNQISPVPTRVVGVSKFFIDRNELTVARYRAAARRGLDLVGDGTGEGSIYYLPTSRTSSMTDPQKAATFTDAPGEFEDFPLNLITWEGAHKICQFLGGNLPTDAQWERAASFDKPGAAKRRFPWGDDVATCDRTVIGKGTGALSFCPGAGPTSVKSAALDGDTSFLGIRGLGGNLREWVIGSPRDYDDPCWRGAGVVDPVCFDPNDPSRTIRGSSFKNFPASATTVARWSLSVAFSVADVGFRCAYASREAAGR